MFAAGARLYHIFCTGSPCWKWEKSQAALTWRSYWILFFATFVSASKPIMEDVTTVLLFPSKTTKYLQENTIRLKYCKNLLHATTWAIVFEIVS